MREDSTISGYDRAYYRTPDSTAYETLAIRANAPADCALSPARWTVRLRAAAVSAGTGDFIAARLRTPRAERFFEPRE